MLEMMLGDLRVDCKYVNSVDSVNFFIMVSPWASCGSHLLGRLPYQRQFRMHKFERKKYWEIDKKLEIILEYDIDEFLESKIRVETRKDIERYIFGKFNNGVQSDNFVTRFLPENMT